MGSGEKAPIRDPLNTDDLCLISHPLNQPNGCIHQVGSRDANLMDFNLKPLGEVCFRRPFGEDASIKAHKRITGSNTLKVN